MPSGLKPDDKGFCRIRRLLGSCLDEPGRFNDPDWNVGSAQERGQLEKLSSRAASVEHLFSSCLVVQLVQFREKIIPHTKKFKYLTRKRWNLRCTLPTHFKIEIYLPNIISLPQGTHTHAIHLCSNVQKELVPVCKLNASCPLERETSYSSSADV